MTRTTWPDVIELHDIADVTLEEVTRWANLFPHVRETHVFAGFPCIHLSSVASLSPETGRRGIEFILAFAGSLGVHRQGFLPFLPGEVLCRKRGFNG